MTELRKSSNLSRSVAASLLGLSGTVDVPAACEAILDYAARLYNYDAASLILVDDGEFRALASRGWKPADLKTAIAGPRTQDMLLLEVAAVRGVPMIVDDTQTSPLWAAHPALRWIRAHATVPLALDDGVFGILCLESRISGAFVETDCAGLETLGLHAAVAIHNARLYEQSSRQVAELELLREISNYLSENRELPELLTLIMGGILKITEDATTARVFLYEEGRLRWGMVLDIHSGISRVIEEPEPDSVYYRVARQTERFLIDQDAQIRPFEAEETSARGTAIALPLAIGQRPVGVASVHFDGIRRTDAATLRLLQLVADQTAVAIENYQYFGRAERRGSELDFLINVLTAAAVARPIAESLQDVARLIRASLNAVAIAIYLPETQVGDDGTTRVLLQPRAVDGADKTRWEIEPVLVGDPNSLAGLVAQDLYAEVIDEIERQSAYVPISSKGSSVVFVPLSKGGILEGLITAEFPVSGNPYDQDMMKLLLILANTLPSVIQNMTLWNQLSESEKRFRQLAESVHEVFTLIDPHLHRVLYVSPAFESIWGRPLSYLYVEQSLDPFMVTIHPDDHEKFISYRNLASAGFSEDAAELRILRPGGEIRWVRMRMFPVENEAGEIYRLAAVTEDITQRKVAEEQALELVVERHKTHLLGEFITNMSHDFRTPLATINTSTYLLERTDDPKVRSKRIQVIGQQVVRLEKLLEGLLTITRLDQGIELKPAPVDLNDMMTQIEPRAQLVADVQQIRVRFEPGEQAMIFADAIKLDQAIMNVVQNAVQYSPEGSEIVLATGVVDSQAFIEVRDSGIGIEPDDLPHVFERFYRTDRARGPETGGIGLGLAIARKLVELHHGSIEIESTVNQGSTVRILIPRA